MVRYSIAILTVNKFLAYTEGIFTFIYFSDSKRTCCIRNVLDCNSFPWLLCFLNVVPIQDPAFLILPILSSLLWMMKIFSKPVDMMKLDHFGLKILLCKSIS